MKHNKPRNLFGLPSVIFAVISTAAFSAQVPMTEYFESGTFPPRSLEKVAYVTLISLLGASAARYSEGDPDVYTPRLIPGQSKVDIYENEYGEEDDGVL